MTWKIFTEISEGLQSLAHTIGDGLSAGYHDVKDVVSGAGQQIKAQVNNVKDEINHVVDGVKDLGGKIIDKGSNLIENTENKFTSIVSTPLMLIAGGLAAFMIFNGKGITDTAQVAVNRF
jgi:hypothetical protein